jgi:hypothetical protein
MKNFLILILTAVLLSGPNVTAQAQPQLAEAAQEHALESMQIFNTGPFACDGTAHIFDRAITQTIKIRKAEFWQGMDFGSRADFSGNLYRISDYSPLFGFNWDHYADPSGLNDQIGKQDFAPDYMLIEAGDTLEISSICNSFAGETRGHIIVTIWYYK